MPINKIIGGNAKPVFVVNDEIANINVTENHLHNFERWFGSSAGQVSPGLQTSLLGFRVTSSATANTFGTPIAVFDGTETPLISWQTHFDMHRIQMLNVQTGGEVWRLRFAFNVNGEANFNAAVANQHYTDICLKIDATNSDGSPFDIICGRIPVGKKIWCAVAKGSSNAAWLEFLVGIHMYPSRPPNA